MIYYQESFVKGGESMRLVLLLICIFLMACASAPEKIEKGVQQATLPLTLVDKMQGKTEGIAVFKTAYGDVPKGASMASVMAIFGQPYAIFSEKKSETWSYDFGKGEEILVYFLGDNVANIQAK
jgi:hypothetical protein